VRMALRVTPAALALVFLLTAACAVTPDTVTIVESRTVDAAKLPAVPGATHRLRLTVHTFRGTRWNADAIVAAVIEGGRLLAQCDVALAHLELRILETPRALRYYYTPDSRRLLRAIEAPRPALFFVEDTKNTPAFDAEAIGLANAKTRPELANTLWVAHGARDLTLVIAHELVHLLSNSGAHSVEAGNLMRAETAPGNDRLTAAQCERLRSHGQASGLLTKAP
jgi:hypothetical protein